MCMDPSRVVFTGLEPTGSEVMAWENALFLLLFFFTAHLSCPTRAALLIIVFSRTPSNHWKNELSNTSLVFILLSFSFLLPPHLSPASSSKVNSFSPPPFIQRTPQNDGFNLCSLHSQIPTKRCRR